MTTDTNTFENTTPRYHYPKYGVVLINNSSGCNNIFKVVVLKLVVWFSSKSCKKGGAVKKYNYPLDTDGVNYPHTINIQIFSSGGGGAKDGAIRDLQKDQESDDGNDNAGQLPRWWWTRFY